MKDKKYLTRSAAEMMDLGEKIALSLNGEGFIALSGDLGTGKTTFVKGVGRALQVKETVKSPSYNICSLHEGAESILVHIDAYRLKGAEDFENLLLEDLVRGKKIICVEWPEIVAEAIPATALRLKFSIDKDNNHLVETE